ncbi:DUF1641 domain-containing protein [Paenibacillus abyssi]|uniref:DUF1641 domain-containing protein n=1 Tax=Paenibacillus abyssi TaxID=1340531 RepID=A0A917D1E2_9BACL|nr:DUF1641 domain-containing protein [Paenibacillus abyssi]GGG04035.1 hypothetical protein GCM10010916_21360 [Paenibacillus abyssi]
MAKAITSIEKNRPTQAEADAEAVEQILQSAAKEREPLLKLIDILGDLNRLGILDAVQGILKNSEQIALIGINQMNKPGAHQMIKNGMGAVQFLSQIDPSKLQTLLQGVSAGIDHAVAAEPDRRQGLWGMLGSLRNPDVSAALSVMMKFLQGMGKGLNKSR